LRRSLSRVGEATTLFGALCTQVWQLSKRVVFAVASEKPLDLPFGEQRVSHAGRPIWCHRVAFETRPDKAEPAEEMPHPRVVVTLCRSSNLRRAFRALPVSRARSVMPCLALTTMT